MEKQFHLCEKTKLLKKEYMNPIRNDNTKPFGGFWTSSYEETYVSDWVQWLIDENRGEKTLSVSGYVLTPKKDVNVYVVDSFEDCEKLIKDYLHIHPAFERIIKELSPTYKEEQLHRFYGIDYEKMQQNYDGFHLTRKGFVDCHIQVGEYNLSLFNGFDCESTIWFNWMFEEMEYIETLAVGKENWNVYEIAKQYRNKIANDQTK